MASAHDDHSRHPEHPKDDTQFLTLEQAIAQGASHGPETTRALAPRDSARDLRGAADPFVTQLPYAQTQLGPRVSRGDLSPEVIVSVTQPFTWGDTAGVQKRVARSTLALVDASGKSARLVDAARAARAWLDLALADQVLELRQKFTNEAQTLAQLARARVTAGEAQPAELALAEGDLADAQVLVIDAEGAHYEAELDLSFAIGKPGRHVEVSGSFAAPGLDDQHVSPRVHPDVTAAKSRVLLAMDQVEQAKLEQAPTVAVGIQYQREGTGDQILTAVATVPIPIAQPWTFRELQQRVVAETARAEVDYVRSMNAKARAGAAHEVHHALTKYQHLEKAALPPLREAHRIAVVRYTRGEAAFSEVSLLRQRLLRAEEQLASALARVHHATIEHRAVTNTLLGLESNE
jgi:outer membrane protein TolC